MSRLFKRLRKHFSSEPSPNETPINQSSGNSAVDLRYFGAENVSEEFEDICRESSERRNEACAVPTSVIDFMPFQSYQNDVKFEDISINELKSLMLRRHVRDVEDCQINQLKLMLENSDKFKRVPHIGHLTIDDIKKKYYEKHNIESMPIKQVIKIVEDLESQKNQEITNKEYCKLCYENEIDCVLIECGHLVSCLICAKKMNNLCPVCRCKFKAYKIHRT